MTCRKFSSCMQTKTLMKWSDPRAHLFLLFSKYWMVLPFKTVLGLQQEHRRWSSVPRYTLHVSFTHKVWTHYLLLSTFHASVVPDWRVIPCPRFVFYSRFLHFSPSLPSFFRIPPKFQHWATVSLLLLSPPNCDISGLVLMTLTVLKSAFCSSTGICLSHC